MKLRLSSKCVLPFNCLFLHVFGLILLQRTGPPAYGARAGWRPKSAEDYGDGGAFPEVLIAQYPLDLGRKNSTGSNALAVQVDAKGKVNFDALARQGHNDKRIVHASFKDLIPLRQRADIGEISLERPSTTEVAAQTEKTKDALAKLVSGAVAAQQPKSVKGITRSEPTYVRYTPANQMANAHRKNDRIMKVVERQQDPFEPPKHKHKKIPRYVVDMTALEPDSSHVWESRRQSKHLEQVLSLEFCAGSTTLNLKL